MYLCFSLTGDLPFVWSGRQGSMCVDVHIHLLYQLLDILYIIMLYFHRSIEETELPRQKRQEENNNALIKKLYIEVTIKDGKLESFERRGIEEAVA